MDFPWEIPYYELPHHAIPCAHGIWRGPDFKNKECLKILSKLGLIATQKFNDGAIGWLPQTKWHNETKQKLQSLERGDIKDPEWRAQWIAKRILSAMECMQVFPNTPPGFVAILNLTKDSFSDGGLLLKNGKTDEIKLLEKAKEHAQDGAIWLDIGAESTRPGAEPVTAEEQLEKLIPAIEELKKINLSLSIDTQSAKVAKQCLRRGAKIINDISALSSEKMAKICAKEKCKVILMHMRGTPKTMQEKKHYNCPWGEIVDEMVNKAAYALQNKISPQRIYLDPGIGFAKDTNINLFLMGRLDKLRALGYPIMLGPSRKSFMSTLFPNHRPRQRDIESAGIAALAAANGVSLLRLHSGKYRNAWIAAWAAGKAQNQAQKYYKT